MLEWKREFVEKEQLQTAEGGGRGRKIAWLWHPIPPHGSRWIWEEWRLAIQIIFLDIMGAEAADIINIMQANQSLIS